MSITVNYIFENFQKVNGIFCDEFATKNRVFYLYGDDMMFWSIVYNKLDVDRDYDFYVFLCQKNCFNTTLKISERTFLELHRPKRKMRQTHSKFRWLEALPSVKSTDCLTFSISSFLFEMVKDEIQNSFGLCCL
jgi:hypothetical protein